MMKKINGILNGVWKGALALAVLALVVSGSGTLGAIIGPTQTFEQVCQYPYATLNQSPDNKEVPGEMAAGGRPWTDQPACLHATVALPGGGDQSRSVFKAPSCKSLISNALTSESPDCLCSSPNTISPLIGHRFTLVGSKPSGTS